MPLSIQGWSSAEGDHHRLHEEITISGGELGHKGFARIPQIGKLQSLMDIAEPIEPETRIFEILAERFQNQEDSVRKAVEARSRERLRFLEKYTRAP